MVGTRFQACSLGRVSLIKAGIKAGLIGALRVEAVYFHSLYFHVLGRFDSQWRYFLPSVNAG